MSIAATGSRSALAAARAALYAAVACSAFGIAHAAGPFIEDIQISRRGNEATIAIELACPMRFLSDLRTQQGLLLEIRVAPLDSCRQMGIGAEIASELHRPVGGQLAYLTEVEYESLGLGENFLMLRFDRPVDYRVGQRGDLRSLQLIVRLDGQPELTAVPPPQTAPPRAPDAAPAAPGRTPLTVRVREPDVLADYVINLQSTRETVDASFIEVLSMPSGAKPYVSETVVGGQRWYRLRVGFFASEQAARAALAPLAARFPRAWIGRAEADEVQQASDFAFRPGAIVAARAEPASAPEVIAATEAPETGGTLSEERVLALQAQGREAMLGQDYEAAIRVYTALLQEPGEHRAEAREYLGLARERNGQLAHARAEYRAYLEQYPGADGVRRVQQRLNGLLMAAETPRAPLRNEEVVQRARWDFRTGLSQYYRRDTNQFADDLPEIVSLSALFSDLDLSMRRTGGAIDVLGRVSVSHLYDMRSDQDRRRGTGNRNRVSYAYFDVSDAEGDWGVRVGRQSLHRWGVLGRFDGAHFSYDWAPDRRVHLTTGHPVESTRNGIETDRQFYGAAVDFDRLVGAWDFSTFISTQTIEGVDDRRAFGVEARYQDERRSLTSMLDYDYDYGELNMALVLGTWQFENRLALTALVDKRMSPVLTTRNALIGQPVSTIEELLLVLTEEQVRELAVDRTAQSDTIMLGLAKPLFERFHVNFDVMTTEIGATVESFGVPAMPSMGQQTYYSTSFVGSGLFGRGDVSIFNVRYGVSDEFTTSQVTWDTRFPVGRRVRLNPRLRFAVWENVDGRRRESSSASFRFLLNLRNRYRLELEVGSEEFLRTHLASRQDSSGTYLYAGYRADF